MMKKPNLRKLYIRFNLRRDHLILLICTLMAVALIVISIFLGYDKQTRVDDQETRNNLDQIIVLAVLIMLIPYSIDLYLASRKTKRYEEEFVGFLYELSELLRGGFDPLGAIKEIASPALESERSLHTLTPHLQKAAAQIKWGVSFEEVISSMAESLKSPLITKYSYLIVQAARLGAINTTIILKSADDLEKTLQLEREKEAELREYIIIIYAAQFILIGLIYMLNSTLLPSMFDMVNDAGNKGAAFGFGFSFSGLNIAKFRIGFFHVIMINAFASGIIAGQLSEGKARHGLKHSAILMILGYTASLVFLIK